MILFPQWSQNRVRLILMRNTLFCWLWLVMVWCERKILLIGWISSQQNRVVHRLNHPYTVWFNQNWFVAPLHCTAGRMPSMQACASATRLEHIGTDLAMLWIYCYFTIELVWFFWHFGSVNSTVPTTCNTILHYSMKIERLVWFFLALRLSK